MRVLFAILIAAAPASSFAQECEVPLGPDTALHLAGAEDSKLCDTLADYLHPGPPPYTSTTAKDVQRLLQELGFFEGIDCQPAGGGSRLDCELEPQAIVRAVDIRGQVPFALLKADFLRRIFLRPGVVLDEGSKDLETQKRRLKNFLEREGYFGSSVNIRLEDTKGAGANRGVRLVVYVDPGPSTEVRRIQLSGDLVLPSDEVESAFRHWGAFWLYRARFRPLAFHEDLDALVKKIRKAGYPEANVSGTWKKDKATNDVDLNLVINSGPRLQLEFIGNKAFDADDLSDVATFVQNGVVDDTEIQATGAAIRRLYQKDGFYDVQIEAFVESPDRRTRVVKYEIIEGPEAKLRKVEYVGNETLDDDAIIEGIEPLTRPSGAIFSQAWVDAHAERDARAIIAFYERQGFATTKVKLERVVDPEGLIARFAITEGPRRTVARVSVAGLPSEVKLEKLLPELELKKGAPFVDRSLGRDRREIVARLARFGYPHARVSRRLRVPHETLGGEATIEYTVVPGPQTLVGGMIIRGNFRTSESLIRNELKLKRHDPLDLSTLGAAKRRLRSLGIFSTVNLTPLGQWRETDETWMLISLEEREVRTLDLSVGVSSYDLFSIGADYRDRNLFGRAIDLDLQARLSNAVQLGTDLRIGNRDMIQARLGIPRPFSIGLDVDFSGLFEFENQSAFEEVRVSGTAQVSRRLLRTSACKYCPQIIGSLGYSLTSSERTIKSDEVDAGTAGGITTAKIIPSLSARRTDSNTDPRSGYTASLRYELAIPEFAGPLAAVRFATGDIVPDNLEPSSFWRTQVTTSAFVTLGAPFSRPLTEVATFGGPIVAAASAGYAVAQTFSRTGTLPTSETYRYGGARSVRGIAEGASLLGVAAARYRLTASAEIRWYIVENIGIGHLQIAGFTDLGMVSEAFADLTSDPTLSVGAALRYVTPVGPMSFVYGWPIVRSAAIAAADPDGVDGDQPVGAAIESSGRFHFSFGYSF